MVRKEFQLEDCVDAEGNELVVRQPISAVIMEPQACACTECTWHHHSQNEYSRADRILNIQTLAFY